MPEIAAAGARLTQPRKELPMAYLYAQRRLACTLKAKPFQKSFSAFAGWSSTRTLDLERGAEQSEANNRLCLKLNLQKLLAQSTPKAKQLTS